MLFYKKKFVVKVQLRILSINQTLITKANSRLHHNKSQKYESKILKNNLNCLWVR